MKKHKEQLLVMQLEIRDKIDQRDDYFKGQSQEWRVTKEGEAYAIKTEELKEVLYDLGRPIDSLSDYLFEQEEK